MKSWLVGGRGNGESYAAGATSYFILGISVEGDAGEAVPIPEDLTARNLAIRVGANTLDVDFTATVQKDTIDTALAITFEDTESNTEKRLSGTDVAFEQDTFWRVKGQAPAGTGDILLLGNSIEIEPDDAGSTLSFLSVKSAGSVNFSAVDTYWISPHGARTTGTDAEAETFTGTESEGFEWTVFSESFDAIYFYVRSGNITWDGTINYVTRVNEANGDGAISFDATEDSTSKVDTTSLDILDPGDDLTYSCTNGTGSGANNLENAGCWLRNDNGKFLLLAMARNGDRHSAGTTNYHRVGGDASLETATETDAQMSAPFAMTITAMQGMSDRERTTSGDSTATLRIDGVDTALSIAWPATGTPIGIQTDTGTIAVAADEMLSTGIITAAGTNRDYSWIGYIAEADVVAASVGMLLRKSRSMQSLLMR